MECSELKLQTSSAKEERACNGRSPLAAMQSLVELGLAVDRFNVAWVPRATIEKRRGAHVWVTSAVPMLEDPRLNYQKKCLHLFLVTLHANPRPIAAVGSESS
jgi:hypothetical protein